MVWCIIIAVDDHAKLLLKAYRNNIGEPWNWKRQLEVGNGYTKIKLPK